MRSMIFAVCVFAAACSGRNLDSPTSPTTATSTPGQTLAQSGTQLPFSGSFTGESSSVINCPPTCPPTTLTINGVRKGTATHLGAFTATIEDAVDLATATATGTFNLTAANGDQLFTMTSGGEDEFIPPNVSRVTSIATVVGGTGRFANASGTFTVRYSGVIDFAAGTSSESGSFEGQINLNK